MNAKEFAKLIDGREYPFDLTKEEEKQAKENGLIVVFGSSDDLVEFRGVFSDEAGACNGTEVLMMSDGILEEPDCGYEYAQKYIREKEEHATELKAVWCPNGTEGPVWIYEIDIPHETFRITEDGWVYCIGIVIHSSALTKRETP